MSENEIEAIILNKERQSDEARYFLGKHMLEGNNDLVHLNENKGLNWLKEAVKNGHIGALEYKQYWDIRFDKSPKILKIRENLEKVIE